MVQPTAARESKCSRGVVLGTVALLRHPLLQARDEMLASKILQHLVTLLDMIKQAAHPSAVSQVSCLPSCDTTAACYRPQLAAAPGCPRLSAEVVSEVPQSGLPTGLLHLVLQARVIQGLAALAASDLPTAGKVGDAALQQLLDAAGSPEREIQVSILVLRVPDMC